MARISQATRSRTSSSRSTNGARRSTNGSGAAAKKRTGTARKQSSAATKTNSAASKTTSAARQSSNGSSGAVPVIAAAAGTALGVVGGVIFGRKAKGPKKVLGVKLPGTGDGFDGLAKTVGEAATQFGRLAAEVRKARERAEKVGKALS